MASNNARKRHIRCVGAMLAVLICLTGVTICIWHMRNPFFLFRKRILDPTWVKIQVFTREDIGAYKEVMASSDTDMLKSWIKVIGEDSQPQESSWLAVSVLDAEAPYLVRLTAADGHEETIGVWGRESQVGWTATVRTANPRFDFGCDYIYNPKLRDMVEYCASSWKERGPAPTSMQMQRR